MLYKVILYDSTDIVEAKEISDEEGKYFLNGGVCSFFNGKSGTGYRFAVGETYTIALDKLFEGIKEQTLKHIKIYEEYLTKLESIMKVINDKQKQKI